MFEQIFTLSAFIWCSIGTGIMKRNLTPVFVALTLFAAFGIVGGMDYEDAKTQQALYCDNVSSGVWPDYEGTYVSECEKEHGPKKVEKVSF